MPAGWLAPRTPRDRTARTAAFAHAIAPFRQPSFVTPWNWMARPKRCFHSPKHCAISPNRNTASVTTGCAHTTIAAARRSQSAFRMAAGVTGRVARRTMLGDDGNLMQADGNSFPVFILGWTIGEKFRIQLESHGKDLQNLGIWLSLLCLICSILSLYF